jgi:16S rRNA (adenine1518-N6/adenine1519-N6)-dimethyltransferase
MKAKKSLGQHFLTSSGIARRVVEAGNVKKGDLVLEIGPGTGILTRELLAKDAKVVAIEKDDRAIPLLHEMFAGDIQEGRLAVVHGDALELDLEKYGLSKPYSYSLVANIPYYITGAILRRYLSHPIKPKYIAVLVQKEVAERIARSKKTSILSLSIAVYGKAKYVETVKARFFKPVPKVDSAILSIATENEPFLNEKDEQVFFDLLHKGFGQKRKQLFGTLGKHFDRETVALFFQQHTLPMTVRAEDVPLPIWIALSKTISVLP